MKLTTKLILIFLILSIVPLSLVGYLSYDRGRHSLRQGVLDYVTTVNILKSDELKGWMQDKKHILEELARQPIVAEYSFAIASSDPLDIEIERYREFLNGYLMQIVREGRGLTWLGVLRPDDGMVMVSTDEQLEGQRLADQDFFLNGAETTHLQSVYYSPASDAPSMAFGTPVKSWEGKLVAVLAGSLDMDDLSVMMTLASHVSDTIDTYIENDSQLFVTNPRFREGYSLTRHVSRDAEHDEGIGRYENYRGAPVIGIRNRIPAWNLLVVTEIERDEAFAPVDNLRSLMLVIGGGVVIVVGLFALVFARTITRPISRLNEDAIAIGRGDLNVRISTKAADEIGELSRSFNHMAENLRATTVSRDDLAREVQQRKLAEEEVARQNKELEAQNEELRAVGEELRVRINEVARARAYSQSLLDSMSDGLVVADLEGKVVDINDAHLRKMGWKREEIVGMSLTQLAQRQFGPERRGDAARLGNFLKGVAGKTVELPVVNAAGDHLVLSISSDIVKDDRGNPVLAFFVLRDVTGQRAMEQKLKESEALYSAMANNSQIGVYIVQDGNFVFVNPQFQKDVGFPAVELLGRHSLDFVHPDDRAKVRKKAIEALKSGGASPHEYRIVTKSGDVRVFLETVASIQYKGRRASLGTQMDITERKKIEDELRESERKYNAIVEGGNDSIVIIRDLKVAFANRRMADLTGYTIDEVKAIKLTRIMSMENLQIVMGRYQRMMTGEGMSSSFEIQIIHKDGHPIPVEITDSLIEVGRQSALVLFIRDVAERKRMEEKLNEYWAQLEEQLVEIQLAYDKLQELDKMKDKFLSTVSHELRTPLTSIKSFAEILLNYEEDRETQKEFLGIINDESDRLTRLVSDFLDLAKIEAGRMQWHDADLDVAEIIQKAVGSMSSLTENKKLDIRVDLPSGLAHVVADGDRVRQVVTNLLSNSIKFTPEAGRITVKAENVPARDETPALIRVSVTDTGIGIAPEYHKTIFEKFGQVGDALKDKPRGTGLGLPICKEILEHYHGSIGVESGSGKGSTFFFTLPASLEVAGPTSAPPSEPVSAEGEAAKVRPKAGKTVLVVDDEEHIRKFLCHELTRRGFQVIEAADGKEAIDKAREFHPSLITLDVLMPHFNGFDVTAVLKNDPGTVDIPVLIISVIEDREKAFRLGADDYMTKPFDIDVLAAKIDGLVQKPKKSVLIVDDDLALAKSVDHGLEKKGYLTAVVHNGQAALKAVRASPPDLIILDIMMPAMDGYEVMKELKGNPQTAFIPIVVMTALDIDGARVKALSLGASECVGKSGGMDNLYKAVEDILGG